jgi:ornithine carbamoyltransferase
LQLDGSHPEALEIRAMAKRDLLTIFDLTREEATGLVDRAASMKRDLAEGARRTPLAGRSVALIFEKASTRTRLSFEVGVFQLGGQPLFISSQTTQMGRGEPVEDTARVLSRYLHMIMIRTYGQDVVEALAAHATIPVINGLTDRYHPCQVLSDLLTTREHGGDITAQTYAWVGDGNNMAHSWIAAAGVLGLDLRLACPEGFEPDAGILARARGMGGRIEVVHDPRQAVEGATVVNTDVWASMGQEAEAERRRKAFAAYCVDESLMALASGSAIFMHCLPAHRGEEVSDRVIEGPASVVWDQAENRLHMQKAIMEWLATATT